MHIQYPKATSEQCSQCHRNVDPIRTAFITKTLQVLHFFCSLECKVSFSEQHLRTNAPTEYNFQKKKHSTSKENLSLQNATFQTISSEDAAFNLSGSLSIFREFAGSILLSLFALMIMIIGNSFSFAVASTLIAIGSIVFTTYIRSGTLRNFPQYYWLTPFFGSVLVCISSLLVLRDSFSISISLFSSLTSILFLLRNIFDETVVRQNQNFHTCNQIELPENAQILTKNQNHLDDANIKLIKSNMLKLGDVFIVNEGMTTPADGIIESGDVIVSLPNQSETTSALNKGNLVLGGTQIISGYARVMTMRVGEKCWLKASPHFANIQSNQTTVGKISENFVKAMTLVFILLTLGIWFFDLNTKATTHLLFIAAAIASFPIQALWAIHRIPFAIADVLSKQKGFLFPSLESFDKTAMVTKVALPLRNILTEGNPEVITIDSFFEDEFTHQLLENIAATEKAALPNPIAKNILTFLSDKNLLSRTVRQTRFIEGQGTSSWTQDGEHLLIGSRQLLIEHGISTAMVDSKASELEKKGYLILFIALGGKVKALISMQDHILPSARAAIQRLLDMNLEIALLSSNHRNAVQHFVKNLDIQHIKSDLLPHEKSDEIRKLREDGSIVLAVGFPENQSSSFEASDISMTFNMNADSRSKTKIQLFSPNLLRAAFAIWIAKTCHKQSARLLAFVGIGAVFLMIMTLFGWLNAPFALLILFGIECWTLSAAMRLAKQIRKQIPE